MRRTEIYNTKGNVLEESYKSWMEIEMNIVRNGEDILNVPLSRNFKIKLKILYWTKYCVVNLCSPRTVF